MKARIYCWLVLLLALGTIPSCFEDIAGKGGGTEAGNTISGVLLDSAGIVANGSVSLFLSDYNAKKDMEKPSAVFKTTSDPFGKYTIEHVPDGVYNLVAKSVDNKLQQLTPPISLQKAETIPQQNIIVKPTSSIQINLDSIPGIGAGYIYIPGTDITVSIDESTMLVGKVLLDNIPSATYSNIIFVSENQGADLNILREPITTHPAEIFRIGDFQQWTNQKQLLINTSPSGANIFQNVYNFPLLIRLNTTNFDFTSAQPNGNDIRFTKSNGTPLPYEIESWDSLNQKADVWVLIDTIWGNNNQQQLNLYWGNPNANSNSFSKSVFDTLNGLLGTYHLNGDAADATSNNITGVEFNTVDTTGIAGKGKYFNGTDSHINLGKNPKWNFGNDFDFSFSVWLKTNMLLPDTTPLMDPSVLSNKRWMANGDGIDTGFSIHLEDKTFRFNGGDGTERVDLDGTTTINDDEWHYCVMTADRDGRVSLYVDGIIDGVLSMAHVGTFDSGLDLILGNGASAESPNPFHGILDEARLSSGLLSPEWIKLSYESQKLDQTLIQY